VDAPPVAALQPCCARQRVSRRIAAVPSERDRIRSPAPGVILGIDNPHKRDPCARRIFVRASFNLNGCPGLRASALLAAVVRAEVLGARDGAKDDPASAAMHSNARSVFAASVQAMEAQLRLRAKHWAAWARSRRRVPPWASGLLARPLAPHHNAPLLAVTQYGPRPTYPGAWMQAAPGSDKPLRRLRGSRCAGQPAPSATTMITRGLRCRAAASC
jgi:hypothetical protein